MLNEVAATTSLSGRHADGKTVEQRRHSSPAKDERARAPRSEVASAPLASRETDPYASVMSRGLRSWTDSLDEGHLVEQILHAEKPCTLRPTSPMRQVDHGVPRQAGGRRRVVSGVGEGPPPNELDVLIVVVLNPTNWMLNACSRTWRSNTRPAAIRDAVAPVEWLSRRAPRCRPAVGHLASSNT